MVGLSCGRRPNVDPPCRPDQAGDRLQVGYFVASSLDTWLVPHVGLFAAGGSAGATTLGGLSLRVPRTLSMRRALKGIPVTVRVPGAGVVRAEIRAARLRRVKRGLIARKTRRATEAGALRATQALAQGAARAAAKAAGRGDGAGDRGRPNAPDGVGSDQAAPLSA